MKTPSLKNRLFRILPALFIVLLGWQAYSGQTGGVMQTIKNATTPVDYGEKKMHMIPQVPTRTVIVKYRYQGGRFRTETRKDKMERYKCSQCHKNEAVGIERAAEVAHGDIVLDHGGKQRPLSCFTCHKKDERDFLGTEKGLKSDLDHSYQLCGQCHFRQKKDWVGGAHGKRISHWVGERVVKNCTSCHDPHSPRFQKRWPKTYSPPLNK